MATDRAIRNAVHKALEVQPQLLKLCDGFHVAPSKSTPGKGYMVTEQDGHVHCECTGFERTGACYHAAALAIELGLMPHKYLVPELTVHASDTAVLRSTRRPLWA